MVLKTKSGFTLIELLVVIAIIGLLSSLAVVNLNSARGKARDAKRINDVKQLALLIEIHVASGATGNYLGTLPAGCDSAGEVEKTTGCGTFEGVDFTLIIDPSAQGTGTTCQSGVVDTCDYGMTINNTTTDDYEICFYIEEGAGSVEQGLNSVNQGSVITSGCTL